MIENGAAYNIGQWSIAHPVLSYTWTITCFLLLVWITSGHIDANIVERQYLFICWILFNVKWYLLYISDIIETFDSDTICIGIDTCYDYIEAGRKVPFVSTRKVRQLMLDTLLNALVLLSYFGAWTVCRALGFTLYIYRQCSIRWNEARGPRFMVYRKISY